MRASRFKIVVLIPMLLVFSGCGKSQQQINEEKAKNSAREALKSLRKLEASTQVGVNKIQYGNLLIESKALINETNRLLPDDSLKKELNLAMQVYQDAATVWNVDGFMDISVEPGRSIQARYNLPRYDKKPGSSLYDRIYTSDVVGLIWPTAKPHLNEAAKLLDK